MIDTHTHLYLPEYDGRGATAVSRAVEAGVEQMIFPNVDLSTVRPMLELAARFPKNIECAIGLHPTEIKEDWQTTLSEIMSTTAENEFVAIGEVGIDLYWDKTFREQQMQAFDIQCGYATEMGLPLIIHCRDGLDETLEVIKGHPNVRAVFHSFGGTRDDVDRIRQIGDYYFGINGIVTFKNSKLRDVLPHIGLERILLETDSPYLAPVPFRGKRNESSYLPYVSACIASALSLDSKRIEEATTASAKALFAI